MSTSSDVHRSAAPANRAFVYLAAIFAALGGLAFRI